MSTIWRSPRRASSGMRKWQVVVLAVLALLLLVSGFAAMVLPDTYAGREIYQIDERYSLRILHIAGGVLLAAGCAAAWAAGYIWQRRTHGP